MNILRWTMMVLGMVGFGVSAANAGVYLTSYNFTTSNLPTIYTDESLPAPYKLRAKVQPNYHATDLWNNHWTQLQSVPGTGTYTVELYWVKYASDYSTITEIGPKNFQTITISSNTNTAPTIQWTSAPSVATEGQSYYIQARGNDSNGNLTQVNVWKRWSPFAFNGGGNGSYEWSGNSTSDSGGQWVEFEAQAVDSNGATSPVIYHNVWINRKPTINWEIAPGSVDYGASYTIRARAQDADGNMTTVNIYKSEQPFAFALYGNGSNAYSENPTSANTYDPVTYRAEALDQNGASSGSIYHTVYVNNRMPNSSWNPTAINTYIGQPYTFTASASDFEGHLAEMRSYEYAWEDINGQWVQRQNYQHFDTLTSSGGPVSRTYTHVGGKPYKWNYEYVVIARDIRGSENWPYVGFGNILKVTLANRNPAPPTILPAQTTVGLGQSVVLSCAGSDQDQNATYQYLWYRHQDDGATDWKHLQTMGWAAGTANTVLNYTFTPTKLGTYYFKTQVDDPYANAMVVNVEVAVIDNTPPNAPTNLATSVITPRWVNLGWTLSNSTDVAEQHLYWHPAPSGTLTDILLGYSVAGVTVSGLTPGGTFRFYVKARDASGNYSPSSNVVEVTTPWESPTITTQPVSQNAQVGQNVTFSVVATATPAPTYQWQKNNVNITGATGSSYSIQNVQKSDAATYRVLVSNAGGTIWSSNATLQVGTSGDTDGDGMSDTYETNNGFDPNNRADGGQDADGDGLTNAAESNLGTNPRSYTSGTSTLGGTIPAGWPNAGNTSITEVVGATAGEMSVDKSGALTYSVPLWVSPGTAGMQPQLALNYSSQAGGGLAGFGWSLGGVSAITRGPQTLALDTANKGVSFSYTDRFYLDGQRLIAIAGNDGYDGTEYRTESESFSRIIGYGVAGQGPSSFKVWTKAGLIMEFGATAESALNPAGRAEVLTWSINKISDTKGNSIRFEYTENTTTGEQLLSAIRYTERAGNDYYASVVFEYEARADTATSYVAGALLSRTHRLKRIKSCYSSVAGATGTAVRTYELTYTARAHTNRSLLTQIDEIGADGKRFKPLTFQYETPSTGAWASDVQAPPVALAVNSATTAPRGTGFIDLNADGLPDMVRYHRWTGDGGTGERDAWLQSNGTWVAAPQWLLPDEPGENSDCVLAWDGFTDFGTRFVDFDGDGRVDVLHSLRRGSTYYSVAFKNTPTGWQRADGSVAGIPDWRVPSPAYLASENDTDGSSRIFDVNGDGRPDIVWNYRDDPSLRGALINTGSGWTLNSAWAPPFRINGDRFFVDVNGDSLPDQIIHWYGNGTTTIGVALNSTHGWSPSVTQVASVSGSLGHPVSAATATTYLGALGKYLPPVRLTVTSPYSPSEPIGSEFVDINGDGLVDVVFSNRHSSEGAAGTYLNTGDGWVPNTAFTLPADAYLRGNPDNPHHGSGAAWMDANGDGIVDLVVNREGDTTTQGVYLGTGAGFTAKLTGTNFVPPYAISRANGAYPTGGDIVDLNGDGMADQVWNLSGGTSGAQRNTSKAFDRLVSVTNAFGVSASVAYAPLTERDAQGNSTVYERGSDDRSGSVDPLPADTTNVIAPIYVVKSVTHDDGVGGQYPVTYRYGGLRSHRLRGSVGFKWVRTVDGRTSIRSTTWFKQEFPYIGMPHLAETRTSTDVPLSQTLTTLATKSLNNGKTQFPYASEVIQRGFELKATETLVTQTITTSQYDDWGNATQVAVGSLDGQKKTTVNTYTNTVPSWILGRLMRSTVTAVAPGKTTLTRTSGFLYDGATGLLTDEAVEPVFNALGQLYSAYTDVAGYGTATLRTNYTYDAFGNKTAVRVTGLKLQVDTAGNVSSTGQLETRTTSSVYDTRGRFPATTTNAAGHTETYVEYDQGLGVLKQLKGPNYLTTSWTYDGFGQKTQEIRADGTSSITRVKWAVANELGRERAKYLVETESTGAAPSLAFHDSFGRAIQTIGLDGKGVMVFQDTVHDSMGRAYASSMPYRNDGSAKYWTQTTSYDLLNRPLTVQTPDDENGTVTTTYEYEGLVTKATDPKGRLSETTKDSQGSVVSSIRNKNAGAAALDYAAVTHVYDTLGNLKSTTASGVTTLLDYDVRGRKTSMDDANMGVWQYRYNPFGELIWQKDAKNQIATLSYDLLGRLNTRVENEGTTTWGYDTSARSNPPAGAPNVWLGKLGTISAPGGYAETHSYDLYGRSSSATRTIDSTPYTQSLTYDSAGRPEKSIYPTNFQTKNVYNAFGFVKEIRRADSGRNDVYWMADDYSVDGRVTGETYGNGLANDRYYSKATGRLITASIDRGINVNGPFLIQQLTYTYDKVGNVKSRVDAATNRAEYFSFADGSDGYDGLDRLRVHRISGGATVTVTYDQRGNITNKSDVGAYTYNFTPSGRTNVLPHAVSQAGGNSYAYDANGNMTSGAGRSITWTTFNQAASIVQGAYSSTFTFGAGRERVKQTSHLGTTVYVGSSFEKVTSGSRVENKHYIVAPTGRVAVHIERNDLTIEDRYFHTDGLGSITAITDQGGTIVKRFAFDAWGKRVDPATGSTVTSNTNATVNRGFTDHEHLDDLGLIHMNGRVYDPLIGRFISADPFVDNSSDSQSYNRYSYVNNNPLAFTDPSGYFKFKDAIKIVAVVVASYFTGGWAASTWGVMTSSAGQVAMGSSFAASLHAAGISANVINGVIGGAAGGFASGFSGSVLNGGNIGDAFRAGVIGTATGALTGGISGKIANVFGEAGTHGISGEFGRGISHGVVSGGIEAVQGGEFRHGFYAGLAGSLAGSATANLGDESPGWLAARTTISATLGGLASVAGGGKFANGAITATFQHLFNGEAATFSAYMARAAAVAGTAAAADGPLPIGDLIAAGVLVVSATSYEYTQRTFLTYTLTNGSQTYVGRTSGYGDPYLIMELRFRAHIGRRAQGYKHPSLDRAIQGYQGRPAIRGREQQMIDSFGGVGDPKVGNEIRGVSKINPFGRLYHKASDVAFGNIAPYTGK